MFYIRADGNSKIGMGHIMRCISVATAVCGKKPVFITADGGCDKLIRDNGFDNIVLNTDYTQMESELPILGGILKDDDIILVDSYQVKHRYFIVFI
jgi:spore coat polysaccharide biosynthesis predicted glycosyltransferase SpsG